MGNHHKIRLEQVEIEEKERQKRLCRIAEAAEGMVSGYAPSWYGVFRGQLRYISGYCLGGQLLCMVLLVLLFAYFQRKGADMRVYLGAASVVSSFVGVFLMMELNRCKSFGMMELEQSCYLGLKQIWCVKMIVFGCLDILLLTVMVAGIAGRASLGVLQVMVYLLAPFVFSNVLQLFAFTLLRGQRNEYLQMGAAVLASMACGIPLLFPEMYKGAYFGFWVLALATAVVCLVKEILVICQKLEEGDGICWN